MYSSWLGVALMSGVVVIGLIASMVLSKDRAQKKASMWAFVSLALLLALFYVVVILYSLDWSLPAFVVACISIPIIIYVVILSTVSRKPEKKESHLRTADSTIRPVSVGTASRKVNGSVAKAQESTQSQQPSRVAQTAKTAKTAKAVAMALQEPSHIVRSEEEQAGREHPKDAAYKQRAAIESYDQETQRTAVTIPAGQNRYAGKLQISRAFEPDREPTRKHGFESGLEPVPESASSSDPMSVGSAKVAFDVCYAKADALKEKGLFAVAARLYDECAHVATEKADARKALFAAMGAYVKADKSEEAKKAALLLHDGIDDLSSLEAMKLDTVLRML